MRNKKDYQEDIEGRICRLIGKLLKDCNLKLIFLNKDHVIECIISYDVMFCSGILNIKEPQCNMNLSQEIISNLESHSIFNLLGYTILW